MDNIKLLQQRLNKIEKELSTCRTSVLQDGWQTQRFAKKSRKWDILAQEKMKLKQQIEDAEKLQHEDKTRETMYCVKCEALFEEECCCEIDRQSENETQQNVINYYEKNTK